MAFNAAALLPAAECQLAPRLRSCLAAFLQQRRCWWCPWWPCAGLSAIKPYPCALPIRSLPAVAALSVVTLGVAYLSFTSWQDSRLEAEDRARFQRFDGAGRWVGGCGMHLGRGP